MAKRIKIDMEIGHAEPSRRQRDLGKSEPRANSLTTQHKQNLSGQTPAPTTFSPLSNTSSTLTAKTHGKQGSLSPLVPCVPVAGRCEAALGRGEAGFGCPPCQQNRNWTCSGGTGPPPSNEHSSASSRDGAAGTDEIHWAGGGGHSVC